MGIKQDLIYVINSIQCINLENHGQVQEEGNLAKFLRDALIQEITVRLRRREIQQNFQVKVRATGLGL